MMAEHQSKHTEAGQWSLLCWNVSSLFSVMLSYLQLFSLILIRRAREALNWSWKRCEQLAVSSIEESEKALWTGTIDSDRPSGGEPVASWQTGVRPDRI